MDYKSLVTLPVESILSSFIIPIVLDLYARLFGYRPRARRLLSEFLSSWQNCALTLEANIYFLQYGDFAFWAALFVGNAVNNYVCYAEWTNPFTAYDRYLNKVETFAMLWRIFLAHLGGAALSLYTMRYVWSLELAPSHAQHQERAGACVPLGEWSIMTAAVIELALTLLYVLSAKPYSLNVGERWKWWQAVVVATLVYVG